MCRESSLNRNQNWCSSVWISIVRKLPVPLIKVVDLVNNDLECYTNDWFLSVLVNGIFEQENCQILNVMCT